MTITREELDKKTLKIHINSEDFISEMLELFSMESLTVETIDKEYPNRISTMHSTYFIGEKGTGKIEILIAKDE